MGNYESGSWICVGGYVWVGMCKLVLVVVGLHM